MSNNIHNQGFTVTGIIATVAAVSLLAAVAVPNFFHARKRSQMTRIIEDLRQLDNGCDRYGHPGLR